MTEEDRQFVNKLKKLVDGRKTAMIGVASVSELFAIIDRLNEQLAELKEAGEPFVKLDKAVHSSEWGIEQTNVWYGISLVNFQDTTQTISIADPEIRRLAQALDQIGEVRG